VTQEKREVNLVSEEAQAESNKVEEDLTPQGRIKKEREKTDPKRGGSARFYRHMRRGRKPA